MAKKSEKKTGKTPNRRVIKITPSILQELMESQRFKLDDRTLLRWECDPDNEDEFDCLVEINKMLQKVLDDRNEVVDYDDEDNDDFLDDEFDDDDDDFEESDF